MTDDGAGQESGDEPDRHDEWLAMLSGPRERLLAALERVFPTSRAGFGAWDLPSTAVADGPMRKHYGNPAGYAALRHRSPRRSERDADYDFFIATHERVHTLVTGLTSRLSPGATGRDLEVLLTELRDDPSVRRAVNVDRPIQEYRRHTRSALTNILRLLSNRYRDPNCCKLCGGAVGDVAHDLCELCGNR